MIKYWSMLITVSGISLSAKLSSLHGTKKRVKMVRFSKQKSFSVFFLSWMQLRTNNWFQTETYFILFEEMEVPICRMTCLSSQILLHRKSPPIMMAASEIAFFLPQFEPKAVKDYILSKILGCRWYCFLCFPSEKLFPFFSVNICHKNLSSGIQSVYFPAFVYFFLFLFWNMLVCTHIICTGWRD